MRNWPLKFFTVVLGATTNVQKNYQVLGVQKLFGHMTMQPLYRSSCWSKARSYQHESVQKCLFWWYKWNFALPEDSRRKIAQSVPGEDEAVLEYGPERYLLLMLLGQFAD